MKMKMLTPLDVDFYLRLTQLLSRIKKEMLLSEDNTPIRIKHGYSEFTEQASIYLLLQEDAKEEAYKAQQAIDKISQFKRVINKLEKLKVLKIIETDDFGFKVKINEKNFDKIYQESQQVTNLPAIYYEESSGYGQVNSKQFLIAKKDDAFTIFPILLENCNTPVPNKKLCDALGILELNKSKVKEAVKAIRHNTDMSRQFLFQKQGTVILRAYRISKPSPLISPKSP